MYGSEKSLRYGIILGILSAFLEACGSGDPFDGSFSQSPAHAFVQGQSCDLWEDPEQISHVKASDERVAYACFGYLHGRDRAWQLDFLKRTAHGRRAEVLGTQHVKSDFLMRVLGLPERAEKLYSEFSPGLQEKFEAYAYGVNYGMREALKKGVYEFQDLNYLPEPWRPQDSVTLILLQSFDQTRKSFENDLSEQKALTQNPGLAEASTQADSKQLVPWETTILKPGEYPVKAKTNPGRKAATHAIQQGTRAQATESGQGSNNWVLAPTRSQSGKAWLANDPHLSLKHPPFWYWANVAAPGWDVIGASLPGVPLMISAVNRFAAWGLTNSYLDVADVIQVPGEETQDLPQTRPTIWVKIFWKLKLPFLFKTYQKTQDGLPVLPIEAPEGKSFVLRWSGFDLTAQDFESVLKLHQVKSVQDADRVFSEMGVPSWNFVFADTRGGIGFRASGKVPKRETEAALGAQSLSLKNLKAWDYLTPDQMPHLLNPARGFIATANHQHWPQGSQF